MHAPCAEQLSEVIASQRPQMPPAVPHCISERGRHTLPSQQPFGQLAASHAQTPDSHVWPLEHAGPAPHWHAPSAEQLSARIGLHATHVAPERPHVASSRVVHALPMQQPPGHERSSQTHRPARQRWPVLHALSVPHRHSPFVQESAFDMSHAVQAAPAAPHEASEGGRHVLPEQQPVAQLAAQPPQVPPVHAPPSQASHARPAAPQVASSSPVRHVEPLQQPAHESASQRQVPATHRCPAAHAGPGPQAQAPVVEQRSARRVSQLMHAPPPVPQEASVGVMHVVPAQQPLGQLVGSHTHVSFTQLCPAPQAGPVPQRHMPFVHALLFFSSQVRHAPRGWPHAIGSGVRHVAPVQQPETQVAAHDEHAPELQLSPAGQAAQAEPALPHADASSPVSHTSPLQQPDGQLAGVQRHMPSTHCWPTPHAPPAPQPHSPSLQAFVFEDGHTTHALPPLPQVVNDGARHSSPEQHPSGHEVPVHAQRPPTHVCPG